MIEERLVWKCVLALALGGWISVAGASTWYVSSSSGNDSADGKSWNTALASIQRAVDVALSNDLINVRKGVYEKIVTSNKTLRIMACDNREDVVIDGKGRFRCAYLGENLAQTNTQLHGFTIRHGYLDRNYGAGVRGGTIVNCEIHGCTNSFANLDTEGGGIYGTFAIGSFIHHNRATHGGAICKGVAERCVLAENEVDDDGGAALDSALVGCLVVGNRANNGGGSTAGAAMQRGSATNCTIVGNFARSGGVIANSKLYNCIVYSNSFTSGTVIMDVAGSKTELVSCSTNNPFFSDAEHGDYTLSAESPCLDAGDNAYVTQDVDLNGNPRIFNGTVDIGAYEFVHGHIAKVLAQQRYPWNGIVDVDFTVTGDTGIRYKPSFVAKDLIGGTNVAMSTILKADGRAMGAEEWLLPGDYRWMWDAMADIGKDFTSQMTISISALPQSYTVKFNANGGSGTMATASFTYGTAKSLTANAFTRSGYVFEGWATSASGAKVYSDKQSVLNLTTVVGGTVNLYAVWQEDLGGVQLWENGPYWAECNVGATKPEEYGYYFWWGDTVGYKRNAANNGWVSAQNGTSFSFTESNCPTYNKGASTLLSMGYIDATGNLVAEYDAATAHLGAPWRMPTDAEWGALISNCTTTWTTRNGVYGRLVMGKGAYASKSIFLPAAGYGRDSGLNRPGSYGYYWSSTPSSDNSNIAWGLFFDSGHFYRRSSYRYSGRSVRPLRGFAK